jgi:anthranilate phosphoribosyltransferase
VIDLKSVIKEVGRGAHGAREVPEEVAAELFGELLDGTVRELELGALLMAYRFKGESVTEIRGFARALAARTARLEHGGGTATGAPRPLLLPSYNGARKLPNLTPLVACMLARRGVPVLIHGIRADFGRTTTDAILRAMGIPPASNLAEVSARLKTENLVHAPLQLLSPGLERLLAARERIGLRGSGHTMAKLLDPFAGRSVLVVPVTHADYVALMRAYLPAAGAKALLLRGHEGEPCAGPRRPLEVDAFCEGGHIVLRAERPADVPLPDAIDAASTAAWTREALAGRTAVPETVQRFVQWCEQASRGTFRT